MKYLLQQGDYLSKEKRIVVRAGLPSQVCDYNNLDTIAGSDYIPVGSVEFVRKYCDHKNIQLPENISYPPELVQYLARSIRKGIFEQAEDHEFVKPICTKRFTGGIKQNIDETVDNSEPVWISEPVNFEVEFRYYIIDGNIVGYSRYDDGEDNAIEPDLDIINQMIADYQDQPQAYTLDVGVVAGKTVLIEVNDAWAIGYYPWGTMNQSKYIELITTRWLQIIG